MNRLLANNLTLYGHCTRTHTYRSDEFPITSIGGILLRAAVESSTEELEAFFLRSVRADRRDVLVILLKNVQWTSRQALGAVHMAIVQFGQQHHVCPIAPSLAASCLYSRKTVSRVSKFAGLVTRKGVALDEASCLCVCHFLPHTSFT